MEPNNTNDNQNGIETTQQLAQINADSSQPKEAPLEEQPSELIFVQPEKNAEAQIPDSLNKSEAEPSRLPQEQPTVKKERKLIKFLRIIVWLLVAIFLPIGIVLRDSAEKSISYANGTYQAKQEIGNLIFTISVIVFALNFIWGTVRWILRLKRKKCSVGRIVGKLIGGGIWRAAVFTPIVLFSLLFLSSFAIDKVSEMSLVEREQTSSEKISAAYANNEISADEYVSYTLSAAFDAGSLPDKFKSQVSDYSISDPVFFMNEHLDELSDETLEKYIQIYTLQNIEFDTDASQNHSSVKNGNFFTSNAYAENSNRVTVVNRAKLSQDKKFVVFYTDQGDQSISDTAAEHIVEHASRQVEKMKRIFDLDYIYDVRSIASGWLSMDTAGNKLKKVLVANGIDENILETAMPFYAVDPYYNTGTDNGTHAFYVGSESANMVQSIISKNNCWNNDYIECDYIKNIPTFPFVMIKPDEINSYPESVDLMVAHEFTHHYQGTYWRENHPTEKTPGDVFTNEATAHLAALKTSENLQIDNILNNVDYNERYMSQIGESIDVTSGYGAVSFFINLYQNTGEDLKAIFETVDGTNNQLQNLENRFGKEAYKQTVIDTTERTILNDYYPEYSISAYDLPSGDVLPCMDACSSTTITKHSASNYVYAAEYDYADVTIKYSAQSDYDIGSLLGKKKDGTWEIVYSGKNSFELDTSEQNEYVAYALANTNYSTNQDGSFVIEIKNNKMKSIIEDERNLIDLENTEELTPIDEFLRAAATDSIIYDFGSGCYGADLNLVLEAINENQKKLSSQFLELIGAIAAFEKKNDYSDITKQIKNDSALTDKSITEAQSELSDYNIVICRNRIKANIDYDTAKATLKSALDERFEIADFAENNSRFSVFGGANIVNRSVSVHILSSIGRETILYSIKGVEK